MKRKLSKIEIATYLRDYSRLMGYATTNTSESLFKLFRQMLIEEGREHLATKEYYLDMMSIYMFFLLNKTYSFMADNLFDYLLEDKLSQIDIPKSIFVNEKDFNKFSKKQIIKFIRDALNHNNYNDKELYNLYKDNGKLMLEISLKNVKPMPFNIRIDLSNYINIMNGILNSSKVDLIVFRNHDVLNLASQDLYSELNKVYYRRYYYKQKINQEEIKKAQREIKPGEKSDGLVNALGQDKVSFVDYKLSTSQKLKILEEFKHWKSMVNIDENTSIKYILGKIIPLGITKIKLLNYHVALTKYFVKSCKSYFDNILGELYDLYFNQNENNVFYGCYKERNYGIELIMQTLDYDSIVSLSLSIYYAYLFDTLITDDIIKIGDNNYPRNKIRNCFVHGRWFNGINECFKLYDCDRGNKNELQYNWRASIPFKEFIKSSEVYYKEYLEKNKNDSFLEYPAHMQVDQNYKPMFITLVKYGKYYIYNLNPLIYDENFIPWGIYIRDGQNLRFVDDKEDIEIFFNEFKESWTKEEESYVYLVNFLKYQNSLCMEYKKGNITLEELRKNDNYFLSFMDRLKNNIDEEKKK